MRWFKIIFVTLATFAVFCALASLIQEPEQAPFGRIVGMLAFSAGLLVVGMLFVAGPLWLILRRLVGANPVGWALLGALAAILPLELILTLFHSINRGFIPPSSEPASTLVPVAIVGLFGALAFLAGWLTWRGTRPAT